MAIYKSIHIFILIKYLYSMLILKIIILNLQIYNNVSLSFYLNKNKIISYSYMKNNIVIVCNNIPGIDPRDFCPFLFGVFLSIGFVGKKLYPQHTEKISIVSILILVSWIYSNY